MPTIFTKIIRGEIPCHMVAEDDRYFAFLDIKPINPGHTLVIPKREVDYLFDCDDVLLAGMMTFSKTVAIAIKKALLCQRVGVMVAGLEVPHAHIHLVPIGDVHDLNFARAREASSSELATVAEKIRACLVKSA